MIRFSLFVTVASLSLSAHSLAAQTADERAMQQEFQQHVASLQQQITDLRKALADTNRRRETAFMQSHIYLLLGDTFLDLCYAYSAAGQGSAPAAALEAETAFQGAILRGAPAAKALSGSGRAAACMGDYEKAVDRFKRALRLDPSLPEIQRSLGIAYKELGRFHNARDALEMAIKSDPDDGPARFHLAGVYLELGEPMLAREQCNVLRELGRGSLCRLLEFPKQSGEG